MTTEPDKDVEAIEAALNEPDAKSCRRAVASLHSLRSRLLTAEGELVKQADQWNDEMAILGNTVIDLQSKLATAEGERDGYLTLALAVRDMLDINEQDGLADDVTMAGLRSIVPSARALNSTEETE